MLSSEKVRHWYLFEVVFIDRIVISEEREERADYDESETASLVQSPHSADREGVSDRRDKPSWFARVFRWSRYGNYQAVGED
jgi:hypothetical protein